MSVLAHYLRPSLSSVLLSRAELRERYLLKVLSAARPRGEDYMVGRQARGESAQLSHDTPQRVRNCSAVNKEARYRRQSFKLRANCRGIVTAHTMAAPGTLSQRLDDAVPSFRNDEVDLQAVVLSLSFNAREERTAANSARIHKRIPRHGWSHENVYGHRLDKREGSSLRRACAPFPEAACLARLSGRTLAASNCWQRYIPGTLPPALFSARALLSVEITSTVRCTCALGLTDAPASAKFGVGPK